MQHGVFQRCTDILTVSGLCLLVGCALPWPNPNIGERSSDDLHCQGQFEKELAILQRHTEEPWAQLRLGMAYENGDGVEKNHAKALGWYLKAALQRGQGNWAEGKFLAVGRTGFYGMNYDAAGAQLRIAQMYETGKGVEPNLFEASLWAQHSLKMMKPKEPQYIDESGKIKPVSQRIDKIINLMTDEQKSQFNKIKESWSPQESTLFKSTKQ